MDDRHFDRLTRIIAAPGTRRRLLGALATLPVAGGLMGLISPDAAEGHGRRKRRKKRHKHGKGRRRANRRSRKPKVVLNTWGCVDAGSFCRSNDQCCSGVCSGEGRARTCVSQDSRGCAPGHTVNLCGGTPVPCPDVGGGQCATSTGNAGVCFFARWSPNPPCTRDVDCQVTDPASACILCEGSTVCALTILP